MITFDAIANYAAAIHANVFGYTDVCIHNPDFSGANFNMRSKVVGAGINFVRPYGPDERQNTVEFDFFPQ
jgi:hypothetical protein